MSLDTEVLEAELRHAVLYFVVLRTVVLLIVDDRPEPLSAAVAKCSRTSVMTRAKLLATVLDKVKEVNSATPASAPS